MLRNIKSSVLIGGNSARRSTVLMNISRSWTALAHQLESLAVIVKSEEG
jgi:hypothetical protein